MDTMFSDTMFSDTVFSDALCFQTLPISNPCLSMQVLDASQLYASQDMDVDLFRLGVQMFHHARHPDTIPDPLAAAPIKPSQQSPTPVTCP